MVPLYSAVWDHTGILRIVDKWGHSVYNPLPLDLNGFISGIISSNGMDYILSSESASTPVFGNSIYKVTCNAYNSNFELAAFFLDTRDCGYPNGSYNDFTIKYLESQNKFYMVEGKGVLFNDNRFVDVTNKIVQLWNVEGVSFSGVNCYENFWENSLGIGTAQLQHFKIIWRPNPDQINISKYYLYRKIDNENFTRIGEFSNQIFDFTDKSIFYDIYSSTNSIVSYKVTSFNGSEESPTNIATQEYILGFDWNNGLILTNNSTHPKLVWVPNTSFSGAYYWIYRAVSNYPVNPSSLNYSLISSVSSSTFEFTDYADTILPGYQYAYYYVVGWNRTSESNKTNYVDTPAEFHKRLAEIPNEYSLSQNFPNTFNPSTKISYSIKEEGLVTLKVYDVLGKEIATLVNENKPEGIYEAEFNASSLPSGMYIYKIQAGQFSDVKKMLLTK